MLICPRKQFRRPNMSANPDNPTLIPELIIYRRLFESAREDIHNLVNGLTDTQFNQRPDPERWAIGECIDHLCVVGAHMIPVIDTGIEQARTKNWNNDGPFTYGFLGNWFVNFAGPSENARKRKLKAPVMYTPTSNHTISRLVKAFAELQDDFIGRVHQANGLDLARVKITSPVTRLIRLSLGQWFALMAGHQERHFLQAQDTRQEIESAT